MSSVATTGSLPSSPSPTSGVIPMTTSNGSISSLSPSSALTCSVINGTTTTTGSGQMSPTTVLNNISGTPSPNLVVMGGVANTLAAPLPPSTAPPIREPDPDAIKMFVGQIPRDWSECDCKKLFDEFGELYAINVLRDKQSGLSRGCCFVTYYSRRSALEAQNALHNIRTLSGMHHPIQMKPADSENRNERKLFVGMLAKKYSENDVRLMFAPFGNIEECTVLRDATGQSKGCAFVTFGSRQCAVNAIKSMNHSSTMDGCSSPLVVKFADTQRDKDARRQQQILMQQLAVSVPPGPAAATAATLAAANPYLALAATVAASHQVQQQQAQHHQQQQAAAAQQVAAAQQQHHLAAATLVLQQQLAAAAAANPDQQLALAAAAATLASNPMMLTALCGGSTNGSTGASTPQQQHMNGTGDLGHYAPSPASNGAQGPFSALGPFANHAGTGHSVLAQHLANAHNGHGAGHQQNGNGGSGLNGGLGNGAGHGLGNGLGGGNGAGQGGGKQMEGPDGSNLFIYHLPAEFSDTDLAQAFSPFGHVLSSKVFIDKQTNLSKCFGFVSYDNQISAQAAIQSMNGFQIGTKRLKVQLKRSKDKPY